MNIFLLGANGRTGQQIIKQALSAGDTVTAFVRSKETLSDFTHSRLTICTGNACNALELKQNLPNHYLVISTLGPRLLTKAAATIYSESATAIVEAMRETKVNKLLVTSTALLFPSNKLIDRVLGFIARHNAKNAGLMEKTISSSGLEWTIVRIGFLNDKESKKFRLSEGSLPSGGGSISRAAVANFFLDEAKKSNHLNKIVGLSS